MKADPAQKLSEMESINNSKALRCKEKKENLK